MSPEQAELTGLDVDTRTDMYSLGVVLYELLVGARPFDRKALLQAGLDEMRRKIREEEPAKPSTRIQSLGDGSTVSARNRKTEPRRLERELHGELDCIAMKALEKDRTRRYGSPAELAADVGRHLRHEPVMAGPPSAAYRLRKFARRHRWGVAVAGLLTLTLVAGTAVSTWQAVRATRAERRAVLEAQAAARVSDFLSDLFRVSEPSEARGNSVTARELLDKGAKQIESELREQPELQARLMHVMGRAYESLGLYDRGELLLERALETRRRVLGGDHPDTLASMHSLGIVYWREGRYGEAERLYRETIEARRRVLGEDHADTLATMNNLAALYVAQGRDEEAEALHEKTLEARRRVLGSDHPETLKSMHDLAGVRFGLGRVEEAEKLLQEVLKTQRRVLGDDHPETLFTMHTLAGLCADLGRSAEAEARYRQTLEARRRALGGEHPDTLSSMPGLAALLEKQGRYDEAERLYLAMLEVRRRVHGEKDPQTARTLSDLACLQALRGRRQEALTGLRRAVEAGFSAADEWRRDPRLESLRADPRFEAILAGMPVRPARE
jgi:tetratricopeptide (TPR) repeat protein